VFELTSTLVVVACAVAVVGMQASGFVSTPEEMEYEQVEDWREESASGIWIGDPEAEFVVTVFIDFTCPYCRALSPVLDSLATDQRDRLAISFHHYSLGRTWSIPSAVAAECAHRQGRFREVARLLYDAVASPRDAPPDWGTIAMNGRVPRVAEFMDCTELPVDSFPRIAKGQEVGGRTGVRGTPTIWVNGTPTAVRDRAGLVALLSEDS
jgi:protein-disulfide isomerase